jgi:hypothetical protein
MSALENDAELFGMINEDATPSEDKLDTIRATIAQLRDNEFEVATLEERTDEIKKLIREAKEKTLPDMFDEAGVSKLGIDAVGNLPPYEIEVTDRYHANIPAERAPEAFDYLAKTGHEDLIKTIYTIEFGLKEGKAAQRFARSLEKAGIPYNAKQSVPWNTLTAWFKTETKRKPLSSSAMELLGASIGRVAKVVKQRTKK